MPPAKSQCLLSDNASNFGNAETMPRYSVVVDWAILEFQCFEFGIDLPTCENNAGKLFAFVKRELAYA